MCSINFLSENVNSMNGVKITKDDPSPHDYVKRLWMARN